MNVAAVTHAQNVNEMVSTMEYVNASSETLLYNSSLVEAELDSLEERLRLLQAQADEDARLIHTVITAVLPSRLPLSSSLPSFPPIDNI